MTFPDLTDLRRRVPTLTSVLLLVALLAAVLPPATANADETDYLQVVDITFPLRAGTDVFYRDDYDASRGGGRHHQATDLMVPLGTPVHAAMGGTVRWMSGDPVEGPPSYGWMVHVAGDDGRGYAYVHLGEQDGPWDEAYAPGITAGARVERGQLLGWAGCSGSATCGGGEHLHFEIHDSTVIDPYDHHDHERINPYFSLLAAEERGDYPGGGTTARSLRFLDVPSDSVHHDNILRLADAAITRGCRTQRFCPGNSVSRQQMASFLVRALELPMPDTAPTFVDVGASNVHAANIGALAAAGITLGCDADRFCPEDAVTRQQMATFLTRALALAPAAAPAFLDVGSGNVHAANIGALAAAGVTRGCADDRFCPEEPVTRQQMATFLVRALEL